MPEKNSNFFRYMLEDILFELGFIKKDKEEVKEENYQAMVDSFVKNVYSQ